MTAVRILQKYSPNPKRTDTYHLYCKYQVLRYKPWVDSFSEAFQPYSNDTDGWIKAWEEFQLTDTAKAKIPNWIEMLKQTEIYLESNHVDLVEMDIQIIPQKNNVQEDWMENQMPYEEEELEINNIFEDVNSMADSLQYWQQDRNLFDEEELIGLETWLLNEKKLNGNPYMLGFYLKFFYFIFSYL